MPNNGTPSTGRLLVRCRKAQGLSMRAMGVKLGRSRTAVLHVEHGRLGIQGCHVLKWAGAYKCDPLALLRALRRDKGD